MKKTERIINKEIVIGLLILLCSILPYIHDAIPKEKTFPGYSSLRVFLYVTMINFFGLIGWLIAYFESKGKRYRFIMIIPVINILYQLFVYIFNLKKTSFNDLNLKIILTFIVSFFVFAFYFKRKIKQKNKKLKTKNRSRVSDDDISNKNQPNEEKEYLRTQIY
ncbi:MARVEL/CASP family protein [Aquimarina algicola]|uniref:Uncharacterized protein n=1 Tax=Aquimarina algicola TaxID=2589995 RepID=A0A504JD50_9FLAO|nr:hypothetical protein [Aquimarina algicola]TPN84510.1 hypothetical protein FHK87_16390 [Aquimarina algicola]